MSWGGSYGVKVSRWDSSKDIFTAVLPTAKNTGKNRGGIPLEKLSEAWGNIIDPKIFFISKKYDLINELSATVFNKKNNFNSTNFMFFIDIFKDLIVGIEDLIVNS